MNERAARKQYEPIWDVEKIEQYFNGRELPHEIRLNNWTHIEDVHKMVDGHIAVIRANNGNLLYKRFYIRLKQLKRKLENEN